MNYTLEFVGEVKILLEKVTLWVPAKEIFGEILSLRVVPFY